MVAAGGVFDGDMWKVTRFPSLGDGEDGFKAEQLFLGWKHILAYRNSKLIDLVTGKPELNSIHLVE